MALHRVNSREAMGALKEAMAGHQWVAAVAQVTCKDTSDS